MKETNKATNSPGFYLGLFAKGTLAIAMLLYLGMHSYNFFSFTFKGDQWIFSILGLFTTSIGFILWLVVYLYAAEDGLEKAVSIVMLFVSLLGEFAVAGFDMYMNITDTLAEAAFTAADLRNMSYIIAGLALLNGLALVAGVAGQQIMDDLSNVKWPGSKKGNDRSNVIVPQPVTVRPAEVEKVTLIPDDVKAMYAPGTRFTDGTSNPMEERPAETPFGKNGR
jgi:hypothetical protein